MKFHQIMVFVLALTCLALKPVHSMDFEKRLNFCHNTSLWLPVLFENSGIPGEEICKVSGGSSCYNVTSLGEGICKAGGGSSCYNVKSLGEGICKAGGGSSCYNVTSLGEGICKAGGGSSCYNVSSFGEGVCKANGGSSCYNVQSLTEGLCKAAGICRVSGAVDLINQVMGLCGTKVLHFGFSRM